MVERSRALDILDRSDQDQVRIVDLDAIVPVVGHIEVAAGIERQTPDLGEGLGQGTLPGAEGIEDLHPAAGAIVRIADEHQAIRIDRDPRRIHELTVPASTATPFVDEVAVEIEDLHAVVQELGDVEAAGRRIDGNDVRFRELAICIALAAPFQQERAVRRELLNPRIPEVGHVAIAIVVEDDRGRGVELAWLRFLAHPTVPGQRRRAAKLWIDP